MPYIVLFTRNNFFEKKTFNYEYVKDEVRYSLLNRKGTRDSSEKNSIQITILHVDPTERDSTEKNSIQITILDVDLT